MRILDRYLIRKFLHSFSLTTFCLLGIYVIIEFFETIDDVVRSGLVSGNILKYLLYSLPGIFFQILPVAFLVAVLVTLGLMSRDRELLAIKAGGISIYRTTSVLLVIALIFCALTFICQETVLPGSNQLAIYYEKLMEGKTPAKNVPQSRIWFWGSKNRIFNIQLVNAELQEVRGIILFELDSKFRLIRRVDAQQGAYRDGVWYFYQGVERTFNPTDFTKMTFREFKQETFSIAERFEDIFGRQKLPEEMTYRELAGYIERLQEAGYRVDKYLVDLHTKISTSFITFIMALIGVSFAVKIDKSARLFNIGLGLLISFIYWIIFYISLSLGHAGAIPPVLAAWLGNFLFLCLGTFLLMTIPT